MINGLNHTSTDTASFSEGSVLTAKQGFGENQSAGSTPMSFASLLLGAESELTATESDETLSLTATLTDGLEEFSADASDSVSTVASAVIANLASSASLTNTAKDPSAATVSSLATDSMVTAVSNVMSTSATLATAQVATSQLATSQLAAASALDSKLIDVAGAKETVVSSDALLNGSSQSSRNEINANLQFKAVMDKSLSAQEVGERLSATIADKVSVQVNAKTPTATIRLDPPDLGKIELVVKLDHDKLQVQINASSNTTRESIQMTSDRLRAELVEQNFLNVEVSVSGEHQQNAEQDFFASNDESIVAENSANVDLDAMQDIDNSELARA